MLASASPLTHVLPSAQAGTEGRESRDKQVAANAKMLHERAGLLSNRKLEELHQHINTGKYCCRYKFNAMSLSLWKWTA